MHVYRLQTRAHDLAINNLKSCGQHWLEKANCCPCLPTTQKSTHFNICTVSCAHLQGSSVDQTINHKIKCSATTSTLFKANHADTTNFNTKQNQAQPHAQATNARMHSIRSLQQGHRIQSVSLRCRIPRLALVTPKRWKGAVIKARDTDQTKMQTP